MIKQIIYNITPYYFIKKSNLLKFRFIQKQTIKKIDNLIKNKEIIHLEIGSGPKNGEESWITMDTCEGCDIRHNISQGIPFPDNSIDMIYSSHVLEHFYYNDLLLLLKECKRVLKEKGRFSASVPNATIYISKYLYPDKYKLETEIDPSFSINSPIDYINYIAYMNANHKYMFDENNLKAILRNIGFKNVSSRKFDANLDNIVRDWESLYIEAIK